MVPGVISRRIGRVLRHHRLASVAGAVFLLLLLSSALAELVLAHGAEEIDLTRRRLKPTLEGGHLFGTDSLGRDHLVRVLVGIRASVVVAITVALVSTVIGACVGVLSGYRSGVVDHMLMRITDGVLTLPGLALLLAVAALAGVGSPLRVGLVIALLAWPVLARVVRAHVASLRDQEFVEAARATGASSSRIIARNILPNTLGPIVVHATLAVPTAILLEASLSFLGFGVQPPTPSLGGLIAQSRSTMLTEWWLVAFPGATIALLCIAVNLVGEGFRSAVDGGAR